MKFTAVLLIVFLSFSVFSWGAAEEAAPKEGEPTNWKANLRDKMDRTIAVMNIIKEDIAELDKAEKKEAAAREIPPEEQSWGQKLRSMLDKALKIMKIIKDDLRDFEKLDLKPEVRSKVLLDNARRVLNLE